jgi:hypothetical protein
MNKKASPIESAEFLNQGYIPTKTFMEYMDKINTLPYKSTLSFDPFLNKLKSLSNGSCEYTKAAISPMYNGADGILSKNGIDFDKLDDQKLQSLLGAMFPYMFLNEQKSFIASPFKKKLYFQTPATMEFFNSGDWLIKVDMVAHKENKITSTIRAGAFLLKEFYSVTINEFCSQTVTLKNIKTGLEKHFEIGVKNDFVEAVALKPLKKLTKRKISQLLNNIYDETIWLEAFPPDNFEFKGFLIATFHDITGLETMSILKNRVTLKDEEMKPEVFFPFVEQQLKNYLNLSELSVGMVMITFEQFFHGESFSLTGTNDTQTLKGQESEPSIYRSAFKKNEPILFDDLTQIEYDGAVTKMLLKNGVKSLILLPMYDAAGNISSIFEIGCPEAMRFNALTLLQLKEFFDLMHLGAERYMQTMESMIGLFIQQQFTSIHQSVKWKFEEVATKHEVQKTLPGFDGTIEPIVFKDIYPLYGQADIVSSSKLRNKSIQKDLTDNLHKVIKLMNIWNDRVQFHLMESYILKAESIIERIEAEFISSDESLIVELLTGEIHPLLHQLSKRYNELPSEPYQEYLSQLDPDLHIVYKQRKDYEQSVSQLNTAISNFLEKDDQKMQNILPHYFEKYKTDGIEYNIYIGDAILKDGGFSPFYLKDFRIWQLVNACEITRLVEKLSPKLPVPIRTAQLLFVYNNSLSIRFRMDEKQFDVDGTYNVRYEILKKRIDKAVIKGTGERLTVAGKVAIVYLQNKDRNEYLEYLEYLVQKGYIHPDIEDLELEKLQGAEGLKALRVSVIDEN